MESIAPVASVLALATGHILSDCCNGGSDQTEGSYPHPPATTGIEMKATLSPSDNALLSSCMGTSCSFTHIWTNFLPSSMLEASALRSPPLDLDRKSVV